MNQYLVAVGLVTVVLAGPAAAASNEQGGIEPSSPWTLEYGPERCSLLRHFGDEKDGVLLEIASFGSRSTFRFTLVSNSIPGSSGSSQRLAVSFVSGARDHNIRVLRGEANDRPAALFSARYIPFDASEERFAEESASSEAMNYNARPEQPQADYEEQATGLALKFSKSKQVSLHTGKMTKPLAALRTCVGDLETSWGLNSAKQVTLSRLAVPFPSTVKAIQWNYPSSMVLRGLSAFVPVRVMVNADGEAGKCVIQSDNVNAAFQDAVCKGLAQRFQPALDIEGNPTASVYLTNVVFILN